MPYTVVNTLFLVKTVETQVKLLSAADHPQFFLLLLVLLTSVAALVYKLMKLVKLPEIWREEKRLLKLKAEFEERERRLDAEASQRKSECDSDDYINGRSGDVPMGLRTLGVPRLPAAAEAQAGLSIEPEAAGLRAAACTAQHKVVIELTTFEIGVLPECGR
jgi:hypothetical protein